MDTTSLKAESDPAESAPIESAPALTPQERHEIFATGIGALAERNSKSRHCRTCSGKGWYAVTPPNGKKFLSTCRCMIGVPGVHEIVVRCSK